MIEIRAVDGGVEIPLLVVPGASRERVLGEHDGRVRVAVTAAPEAGKANRAVIRLVAGVLGVRRNALELTAGATSRRKRVTVSGLSEVAVRGILDTFCRRSSR